MGEGLAALALCGAGAWLTARLMKAGLWVQAARALASLKDEASE